jgi:DNA-binding beta-propeller fold protein YncE
VIPLVLGQGGSFASSTCNLGGVGASSLCFADGLTLDAAGNLYVADFSNNRVLEFDDPLNTDTVADLVFGQGGSFASDLCNSGGRSADSMCGPSSLGVDGASSLVKVIPARPDGCTPIRPAVAVASAVPRL